MNPIVYALNMGGLGALVQEQYDQDCFVLRTLGLIRLPTPVVVDRSGLAWPPPTVYLSIHRKQRQTALPFTIWPLPFERIYPLAETTGLPLYTWITDTDTDTVRRNLALLEAYFSYGQLPKYEEIL